MKFIHAVVFEKDTFNNSFRDITDWDDLIDGDYIVHALYDCEREKVVMVNDNCHSSIEPIIGAYLEGVARLCEDVETTLACIILKDGHFNEYDEKDIVAHIKEGLYVEVN